MVLEADLDGAVDVLRQQAIVEHRRDKRLRLGADDLEIGRIRRIQVRDGDVVLGLALAEAGLRLGQIGAGPLADLEPVGGGTLLLLQEDDVLLAQFKDRLRLDDERVGGNGVEEHVLFGQAQRLAAGEHRGLGLLDVVLRLETAEERLLDRDADGARRQVEIAGGSRAAEHARRRRTGDHRTIAGQRLRNAFVDRTQGGALGVQGRIVAIGERERLIERIGAHGRGGHGDHGDSRSCHQEPGKKHCQTSTLRGDAPLPDVHQRTILREDTPGSMTVKWRGPRNR